EETLYDVALSVGADDITDTGEAYEIVTAPEDIEDLRSALEAKGIKYNTLEVQMIPQTNVTLTGKPAQQTLKLLDALEDLDDVQAVSSNFDISDEEMAQLQG
ncbi:MAG TPA: YebC/PmpR family DNA-binding transcriptional regulator, partial [Desulfomonilia bacterium]|nr:YebC/PmpR family DNA-binding transcriptional regulator [Desulfomonilia bacterium]